MAIVKGLVCSVLMMGVAGCLATTGSTREIATDPSGALVRVEGFGECTSPCTIKLDGPRKIKIAKVGYVPVTMTVNPGRGRISVPLTLAAPTDEVDETALPDLD